MSLTKKVKEYAKELLEKGPTAGYPYHNLKHTQEVVQHAGIIGQHEGLDQRAQDIVIISAWFHDIGYTKTYQQHEEEGVEIAKKYLGPLNHGLIDQVESCIIATRLPQNPSGHIEEILCDADMFHLSEPGLIESSDRLRKEINMVLGKKISLPQYLQQTLHLLESHHYFTSYGQKYLEPRKLNNHEIIKNYLSA